MSQKGRYGIHGGQYIPETLMNEIKKLEDAYEFYKKDEEHRQFLPEPECAFLLPEALYRPRKHSFLSNPRQTPAAIYHRRNDPDSSARPYPDQAAALAAPALLQFVLPSAFSPPDMPAHEQPLFPPAP